MFNTYLKLAWRHAMKNKLLFFINITGFAMAMSICLVMLAHIKDVYDYDSFHSTKNKVYRILTQRSGEGGSASTYATSPFLLAQQLRQGYNFIDKTTRVNRYFGDFIINHRHVSSVKSYLVDSDFFSVFDYPLDKGSFATEPNTALLSHQAAERFFGTSNPIGQLVQTSDFGILKITGVLSKKAEKSHLKFNFLLNVPPLTVSRVLKTSETWDEYNEGYTYILLKNNISDKVITNFLSDLSNTLYNKSTSTQSRKNKFTYLFRLQSLVNISPSSRSLSFKTDEPLKLKLVFEGVISLIILALALFNYINLSLAISISRTREVGIRKTAGANRKQVIGQFLIESVSISLLSLGLAFVIYTSIKQMDSVQQYYLKDVTEDYKLGLLFIAFALIAGLVAGIGPATILSKFSPIAVLQGNGGLKRLKGVSFLTSLIVIQFTVTLVSVMILFTIYRQYNYLSKGEYGFQRKHIFNIPLNDLPTQRVMHEISSLAEVVSVSPISAMLGEDNLDWAQIKSLELKGDSTSSKLIAIDRNFLSTMHISLMAGQNVPPSTPEAPGRFVLINESAVEAFKLKTPKEALGKNFFINDSTEVSIIGVVPNFKYNSLRDRDIYPLILSYQPSNFHYLNVLVADNNQEIPVKIRNIIKRISPTAVLKDAGTMSI